MRRFDFGLESSIKNKNYSQGNWKLVLSHLIFLGTFTLRSLLYVFQLCCSESSSEHIRHSSFIQSPIKARQKQLAIESKKPLSLLGLDLSGNLVSINQ